LYFAGQYNRLVELWKVRVAAAPNEAQNHVSLAAAYLLLKDRKNATIEIQKAMSLDPKFKEQGEQYLKAIRAGTL
jgi:Tfp pilus assembly protein PilF